MKKLIGGLLASATIFGIGAVVGAKNDTVQDIINVWSNSESDKDLQIKDLQQQLASVLADKTILQTQVLDLEAAKLGLENELEEKKESFETFKAEKLAEIAQKDGQILLLQNERNQLLLDKENNLLQIQEKENAISILEQQKVDLQNQIAEKENEILNLEAEIALYLSDIQSLNSQVSDLQQAFDFLMATRVNNAVFSGVDGGYYNFIFDRHIPYSNLEINLQSGTGIGDVVYLKSSDFIVVDNKVGVNLDVLYDYMIYLNSINHSRSNFSIAFRFNFNNPNIDAGSFHHPRSIQYSNLIEQQQLEAPTIENVDFLNQTISFTPVSNSTGYELFVDNQSYGQVATHENLDLKSFPINDGSVVGVKALGDGSEFLDSEIATTQINFMQLQQPTLTLNGTILTVSNIDPLALANGDVYIEGNISRRAFLDNVSSWENSSLDIAFVFHSLFQTGLILKDEETHINLGIRGFGYVKASPHQSLDIIYDFYEQEQMHRSPEFLSFNEETREIQLRVWRESGEDQDVGVSRSVKLGLMNEGGNILDLHWTIGALIDANEESVIFTGVLNSQVPIQKGFYKIVSSVFSYGTGASPSDWVSSIDLYEFEFKEVPSIEDLQISGSIITFTEDNQFNYWLQVNYRETWNQVIEPILITSNFDLSSLELESGFYDIWVSVAINHNFDNHGYAIMGANSNRVQYDVN